MEHSNDLRAIYLRALEDDEHQLRFSSPLDESFIQWLRRCIFALNRVSRQYHLDTDIGFNIDKTPKASTPEAQAKTGLGSFVVRQNAVKVTYSVQYTPNSLIHLKRQIWANQATCKVEAVDMLLSMIIHSDKARIV